MRLRWTAFPTCREMVKPNRAPSTTAADPVLGRALASTTNAGVAERAPLRTRRNSERRFNVINRKAAASAARAPPPGGPGSPVSALGDVVVLGTVSGNVLDPGLDPVLSPPLRRVLGSIL